MKRVAIISHSAGKGGSERVATMLANHFDSEGHKVFFYSIHSDTREYPLNDGIKYEFCETLMPKGLPRQIERSMRLRKFVLKNKIDVMISFIYLEGCSLIGCHKLKKIYSLRNEPSNFYYKGLYRILREKLYRDADYVVFQTPDARAYFDESIQEHGVLIANPLKEGLPYWSVENHKKQIVSVCRMAKQKNLPMLIDGFKEFCKTHDDYELIIYGDGPIRAEIEEFAKKSGVGDKIHFPGFCSDVHEKLLEAEIFVSTSDFEGISNSMIEALGVGIPTICTDCPAHGARLFINSGENGFLIPVGDTAALAKRLNELADNKELQKRFSNKSVKIREELSFETIFGKWDDLL
ncbi:MAG: glycosyltransferase [Candidatus Ornithomonoglobus sp.]